MADLLANPVYLGMVEWEGVIYPGQHKPLVSADTFHRVQQLLAARAMRGIRERRHDHELKGVLWCGVTRRMAKLEGERRKLLDAYYAGAIDVAMLRSEQERIGGELRTTEQRLASVDTTLQQWREVLETAMRFASDCGQAYRRASHKTRRLFNAAVFDRLEVRDRRLAGVAYQPPFDLLFSRNGFEYDTVVAPTYQHANRPLTTQGPTIRL